MLADAENSPAQSILDSCIAALSLAPDSFPPDLPTTELLSGAPAWYDFEHKAWAIGEQIRQELKAHPELKRDMGVSDAILQVVCQRNLRRGRESFAMALSHVGAAPHAAAMARFLDDPDICGHAADALLKMRATGYSKQVTPLASHNRAWIRRVAKRYLERYNV